MADQLDPLGSSFRCRAKDCGMFLDYQSQQSNSPWFGQSDNHGICQPS